MEIPSVGVVLVLSIVLLCGGVKSQTLSGDLAALLSVQASFAPNDAFSSWTGIDPCGSRWKGVFCANASVLRLDLSKNALFGILTPQLGNLVNMEELYLNDNNITGSIPPELGNMSSIITLWLHDNHLTGTIPPTLGNMKKCIDLTLNNNNLTGNVPATLSNVTNLRVSNNNLCSETVGNTCTSPPSLPDTSTPAQILIGLLKNPPMATFPPPLALAMPAAAPAAPVTPPVNLTIPVLNTTVPAMNQTLPPANLAALNSTLSGSVNSTGVNTTLGTVSNPLGRGNATCGGCDPSNTTLGLDNCTCVVPNVYFLQFSKPKLADYEANDSLHEILVNTLTLKLGLQPGQVRVVDARGPQVIATIQILPLTGLHLDADQSATLTKGLATNGVNFTAPFHPYVFLTPLNPHRPYPISTTSSKNDGVLIAVFFGLIYPLIVAAIVIGYLCLRRKGGDARPHARDVERGEMSEAEKQAWQHRNSRVIRSESLEGSLEHSGSNPFQELNANKQVSKPAGFKKPAPPAFSADTENVSERDQWGGQWDRVRPQVRQYSFEYLQKATGNFSRGIGEGSLAKVFLGHKDPDPPIAVSCLRNGAAVRQKDFIAHVAMLSSIPSPHLVALLGYCLEGEEKMLVHELMINGSLHDRLHGQTGSPPLDWGKRIRIARGAALGLAFLHEGTNTALVHTGIKPSNILIDQDFNGKVAGYGAAHLAGDLNASAPVLGSFAYNAPEMTNSGIASPKSDVFSLGVILLELLTGKRPVDTSQPKRQQSLLTWVLPQLEAGGKKFFSFVDPGLKHTVSRPHLAGLATLAKRCLEGDPGDRPTAAEVALQLGGLGLDENVDLEASVGSVSTKDLLRREASRSPLRRTMTPMEKVPEVMSEVDLSGDDGSRAVVGHQHARHGSNSGGRQAGSYAGSLPPSGSAGSGGRNSRPGNERNPGPEHPHGNPKRKPARLGSNSGSGAGLNMESEGVRARSAPRRPAAPVENLLEEQPVTPPATRSRSPFGWGSAASRNRPTPEPQASPPPPTRPGHRRFNSESRGQENEPPGTNHQDGRRQPGHTRGRSDAASRY